MKKWPIPDRALKNNKDIRDHITELVFNCLAWMRLDGYAFFVTLPGDDEWFEDKESASYGVPAGISVTLDFPYKKFTIAIQKDSINNLLKQPLSNSGYWNNLEGSVLHEVTHILVWRIAEIGRRRWTTPKDIEDAEEELVDHIALLMHDEMIKGRKVEKAIRDAKQSTGAKKRAKKP